MRKKTPASFEVVDTSPEPPKEFRVGVIGDEGRSKACKSWDDVLVVLNDLEPGSYTIKIDEMEVVG